MRRTNGKNGNNGTGKKKNGRVRRVKANGEACTPEQDYSGPPDIDIPQETKHRWRARCTKAIQRNKGETAPTYHLRKAGRPPLFDTPEELWEACCEYFDWIEETPFISVERKITRNRGGVQRGNYLEEGQKIETKMNAMTLAGLCLFLDMDQETWRQQYKQRAGFRGVCAAAEEIIWDQKFKGAAAGLLNHAIIARQLGLVEQQEHSFKGGGSGSVGGTPFNFNILPPSDPAIAQPPEQE